MEEDRWILRNGKTAARWYISYEAPSFCYWLLAKVLAFVCAWDGKETVFFFICNTLLIRETPQASPVVYMALSLSANLISRFCFRQPACLLAHIHTRSERLALEPCAHPNAVWAEMKHQQVWFPIESVQSRYVWARWSCFFLNEEDSLPDEDDFREEEEYATEQLLANSVSEREVCN